MSLDRAKTSESSVMKAIVSRFAFLLSAQGVEGVATTLFGLYLAWLDATLYGEVMYAVVAGGILFKVVQYGLYYPLVGDLAKTEQEGVPEIINQVNIIKVLLLVVSMLVVWLFGFFKGLSFRMAWLLFFVSLGFGLEALAETFFAEFRVRGRQDQEARIKIAGSVLGYGFGFVTAFLGMSPLVVGQFRLISGIVRLVLGFTLYAGRYSARLLTRSEWHVIMLVVRAATVFALIEILGILYNRVNIFFLEDVVGVTRMGFYTAAFTVVDSVSLLGSEQLLGWVIFPVLAALWWKNRKNVTPLVRSTAQWLLVLSYPPMFCLYIWSDLIIGTVLPGEFRPAAWMTRYLIWTIVLSFECNLFCYVMMVTGAAKMLLVFTAVTTALCFLFNMALVYPYGLLGACLVIILTKLTMTILTFVYCQLRFRFLRIVDFLFPGLLAAACLGLFFLLEPHMFVQRAVLITFIFYCLVLWRFGRRFMGRMPRQRLD
jgi:O-antigen/teichoic acid export membrane protein